MVVNNPLLRPSCFSCGKHGNLGRFWAPEIPVMEINKKSFRWSNYNISPTLISLTSQHLLGPGSCFRPRPTLTPDFRMLLCSTNLPSSNIPPLPTFPAQRTQVVLFVFFHAAPGACTSKGQQCHWPEGSSELFFIWGFVNRPCFLYIPYQKNNQTTPGKGEVDACHSRWVSLPPI